MQACLLLKNEVKKKQLVMSFLPPTARLNFCAKVWDNTFHFELPNLILIVVISTFYLLEYLSLSPNRSSDYYIFTSASELTIIFILAMATVSPFCFFISWMTVTTP